MVFVAEGGLFHLSELRYLWGNGVFLFFFGGEGATVEKSFLKTDPKEAEEEE